MTANARVPHAIIMRYFLTTIVPSLTLMSRNLKNTLQRPSVHGLKRVYAPGNNSIKLILESNRHIKDIAI